MVGRDSGSLQADSQYNKGYPLLYCGGLIAEVVWLGLKVGGQLAPFYIHQVNRVNSRNGSAMMTAVDHITLVTGFLAQCVCVRVVT